MSYKSWLAVTIVLTALLAGCGKKEKNTQETSPIPELSETTQAGSSDTGDIFDEFYDDVGTEKTVDEQPVAEETFSTSDYGYTPQFVPDGRYVVQVSCVGPHSIAEAQVRKLEDKGYPAYIAEVENPTPDLIGTYYRIRIGGFTGVSEAREFGNQVLVPAGYDYWVDNRANDNVGMSGYGLGGGTESDYGYSDQSYSSESESYESSSTSQSDSWGQTESSSQPAGQTADTYQTETSPEATPASTSEDTWSEEPAAEPTATETATTSEPAATEASTTAETATTPVDEGGVQEPAATEEASGGEAATESAPAAEGGGDEWDDWGDDW
jgi:hypothetical protein